MRLEGWLPPEVSTVATSRAAAAARSGVRTWREPHELALIAAARNGDERAMDDLIRRYHGFVRLKASSYFLAGGDSADLVQEGLVGLFKAVRDFRSDKETSFRSFAELCITRQIITAIKTATRYKHAPLNTYVSFSHTPAGQDLDTDCTLGGRAAGPGGRRPSHLRHLLGRAPEPARVPGLDALTARIPGPDLLPRGSKLRGDRRPHRLRPQDGRQRAPAGQAEGARPSPGAAPAFLAPFRFRRVVL